MKFGYFLMIFAWIYHIVSSGTVVSAIFLGVAGIWILLDAFKDWRCKKNGE